MIYTLTSVEEASHSPSRSVDLLHQYYGLAVRYSHVHGCCAHYGNVIVASRLKQSLGSPEPGPLTRDTWPVYEMRMASNHGYLV